VRRGGEKAAVGTLTASPAVLEARLIAPLTNEAPARVKQMLERQAGAPEE
jgi:hypothetical protein